MLFPTQQMGCKVISNREVKIHSRFFGLFPASRPPSGIQRLLYWCGVSLGLSCPLTINLPTLLSLSSLLLSTCIRQLSHIWALWSWTCDRKPYTHQGRLIRSRFLDTQPGCAVYQNPPGLQAPLWEHLMGGGCYKKKQDGGSRKHYFLAIRVNDCVWSKTERIEIRTPNTYHYWFSLMSELRPTVPEFPFKKSLSPGKILQDSRENIKTKT